MDILNLPISFAVAGFSYAAANLVPIALGALLMLVFVVLFLHRNLKTRPEWVIKTLAFYASKLEPVQDWYERTHTFLLRARAALEAKRAIQASKER